MHPLSFVEPFRSPEDANILATAIVDTVREPVLVLDADLQIIVASRSFYLTFDSTPSFTQGRKFCDIDDGVWNIADLRLEKIAPEHGVMEGFEVERDFRRIGQRTMLLNARKIFSKQWSHDDPARSGRCDGAATNRACFAKAS